MRILLGAFIFGIIGLFTVVGVMTPGMGWFLNVFLIPFWAMKPPVPGVIVESDRREHTGHGRGCGGGAGQADAAQVGAQQVERVLVEGDARAGGDLGRGHVRKRAAAAAQIAEGGAFEQDFSGRSIRPPDRCA